MNNNARTKKLRYVLAAALLLAATAFLTVGLKRTKAFVMPSEIWETFDMKLSEQELYGGELPVNTAKGFKLTGTRNSYARLANVQSGELKTSLLAFSGSGAEKTSAALRITDADDENEFFDIVFDADVAVNNVKVGIDGKFYGIYHELNNPQSGLTTLGITKNKNSLGIYTNITVSSSLELSFEPDTMRVYAGNGKVKLLVWDLSESINDGADCGKAYEGFRRYGVSLWYPNAGKGEYVSTVIYKINNVDFGGKILDGDELSVNAFSDVNGKTGESYVLPAPFVTGLYSVADEKIFAEVFKESATVMKKTEYYDGMSFLPKTSGVYTIKYTCGRAEKNVSVTVKDGFAQEISVHGEYAAYLPTGDTIELFPCEIITEAKVGGGKTKAFVSLFKDGREIEGYAGLPADESRFYTFVEKGEYIIKYFADAKYSVAPAAFTITVGDEGCYFSVKAIKNAVSGETIRIPECSAVINGETVAAESKVVFPSGKCFSHKNIALSEPGEYKVVYTAIKDGTVYKNEVDFYAYADIVDCVTANGATVTKGASSLSDKIRGLIVNGNNSASVTFKDAVNLSESTKNDLLLELIVDPTVYGDEDFSELEIKITDAVNPENYIAVTVNSPSDKRSYAGTGCTVSASVSGRERKALRFVVSDDGAEGWAELVDGTRDVGYVYPMSFGGTTFFQPIENQKFRLYYDNEEKAIYLGKPWICLWNPYWRNYYKDTETVKLIDFDDEAYFSKLWGGFTDGNAIVSVTTRSLSKSNARYVITEFNGSSFADELLTDSVAPVIRAEVENDVPFAVVGREYPLFGATAYDSSSGNCTVKTKVFYMNTNIESEVTDGKYIPYYAGDYRIVYSAKDAFGNYSEKTVWVTARKQSDIEPIALSIKGSYVSACSVGERIFLSEAEASGGSGKTYYYDLKVCFNGKELQTEGEYFIPQKAGIYTVKHTVRDYVGNEEEKVFSITAMISEEPVLDGDPGFAPIYVTGGEYVLNAPNAIVYDADGKTTEIAPTISVSYDGGNTFETFSDGKFVPKTIGRAILKYVYEKNGFKKLEKTYDVNVVGVNAEEFDITDYFAVDHAEKKADEAGVAIKYLDVGAKALFVKGVYSGNFSVNLKTSEASSSVTRFTITLTDAVTGISHNVVFAGSVSSRRCVAELNGRKQANIPNVFGGNNLLTLKYVNTDKAFYLGDGSRLFIADADSRGKPFDGFSEFVYFSLSIDEANEGDTVTVTDISGQALAKNDGDYATPQIVYGRELKRRVKPSEQVILPAAKGYDVLSDAGAVTLSVTGTSLNNITADKEYTVTFDKAGRYPVVYECRDSAGNVLYDRFTITVTDASDFDFEPSAEIKASLKKGEKITVPGVVVSDRREVTVRVFAISPNGKTELAGAEYEFKASGEYVFRYFVYDANYNYVIKEYRIKVR